MENKQSNKSIKTLGFWALLAISIGQVIGVGVINTTGLAIAETGKSTWLAYASAVFFGFVWILPAIFFASFARFRGGYYALVSKLIGERAGGLYSLWYVPMYLACAMVGIGIGNYVHAIFPMISVKVAGFALVTLFYVINLLGVNQMSKLQKPMTLLLSFCLLIFAIVGAVKANAGALDIGSDGYFLNGTGGFFNALVLLIYSTSGQGLVIGFDWQAKNPKKDIPKVIFIATLVVLLLYVMIFIPAVFIIGCVGFISMIFRLGGI